MEINQCYSVDNVLNRLNFNLIIGIFTLILKLTSHHNVSYWMQICCIVYLYACKTETINADEVSSSVFSNINCIIYLLIWEYFYYL